MLMIGSKEEFKEEDDENEKSRKERIKKEREEDLCDTFRMFDTDKSGYISLDELSQIMINFSGLTQNEVNIILNEADVDRDGEVTKYQIR